MLAKLETICAMPVGEKLVLGVVCEIIRTNLSLIKVINPLVCIPLEIVSNKRSDDR